MSNKRATKAQKGFPVQPERLSTKGCLIPKWFRFQWHQVVEAPTMLTIKIFTSTNSSSKRPSSKQIIAHRCKQTPKQLYQMIRTFNTLKICTSRQLPWERKSMLTKVILTISNLITNMRWAGIHISRKMMKICCRTKIKTNSINKFYNRVPISLHKIWQTLQSIRPTFK